MTPSERNTLLAQWMRRSSDDEANQQARAERMVCQAIQRWDAFAATPPSVYAKGSYPNNTNVRRDSDVDIVVEATDCHYFEYAPGVTAKYATTPYTGPWSFPVWRREVAAALQDAFGTSVDTTGSVAIHIPGVSGSRPRDRRGPRVPPPLLRDR